MMEEHLDDLLNMQAELYAKTLSVSDMTSALAYYDSPAGRDWIAAQPQLAKGQVISTTQWVSAMQPEMISRVQKLINEKGWDK